MIFVSYAREDATGAQTLMRALTEAGLPCLIDPPLACAEVFWRDRLALQMADCSWMVMLESADAQASPWVQQERAAFGGRRCAIHLDGDGAAAVALVRQLLRLLKRRPWPGGKRLGAQAAVPAADDRQGLMQQAQCQHQARMSRPRPQVMPAFDGDTAWLAQGRIELRRLANPLGSTWLARQPISNALYREFIEATGHAEPPTWVRGTFRADALPVTGVTWFEAAECAAWFGGVLPTEREWAWAAQSGPLAHAYATADGRLDASQAHFGLPFGTGAPVPVGLHAANAAGYWGLCGNTWDWCADLWGPGRAIRGGGWMDRPAFCRVAARYRHAPIDRDCCVGVRLALHAPPSVSLHGPSHEPTQR